VWFIALAVGLHAQTYTGSIRGRVTDPAGMPAAGAVVTITGTGANTVRKTTSNEFAKVDTDITEFQVGLPMQVTQNFTAWGPNTQRPNLVAGQDPSLPRGDRTYHALVQIRTRSQRRLPTPWDSLRGFRCTARNQQLGHLADA
jgi:hypothetical protein